MNLLLTGANGFTGRHLATAATAGGFRVIPLAVDLTDRAAVAQAVAAALPMGEAYAVVHLAALAFVAHHDAEAFYRVNVLGTDHLLAAVAAQPVAPMRVLVASSANVYGNAPRSPVGEEAAPAPVNHYAASKLAMEHIARTWAARVPLVIARPFNYTGEGQAGQFVIPKLVDHFTRRAPVVELGNLQVEREYNDVRFVCASYLHLLRAPALAHDVFNIATGVTHSLESVIARLTRLTGHAIEVRVNPAFVRANEIARLAGDPTRLRQVWQGAGATWPDAQDLDATLARMLQAGAASA